MKGFLFQDEKIGGGIQVTGNYPGRARNVEELRDDLEFALSLIPGSHKVNLHAIYADTEEKVDLDELNPGIFKPGLNGQRKIIWDSILIRPVFP